MACKNCDHLPDGMICANRCSPDQFDAVFTPNASKAVLLERAFSASMRAAENPVEGNIIAAQRAEIDLIRIHLPKMHREDRIRAERTILSIQQGQRRFDDQHPDLKRRAA